MNEQRFIISGLRDVGNGPSEGQHSLLQKMRQDQQVQLWALSGSEEECENSWREFILAGTPDWTIYS